VDVPENCLGRVVVRTNSSGYLEKKRIRGFLKLCEMVKHCLTISDQYIHNYHHIEILLYYNII
jgi:hypothetical protein